MSDVITIGIAGGTGSGKTTITRRILDEFGGDVSVLYHDNYYKRHLQAARRHSLPRAQKAQLRPPECVRHAAARAASRRAARRAGDRVPDI